jgi:hypothetical protein
VQARKYAKAMRAPLVFCSAAAGINVVKVRRATGADGAAETVLSARDGRDSLERAANPKSRSTTSARSSSRW